MLLQGVSIAEDQALIIGCCGQYANGGISLLRGTKNDARHIRDLLIERGVKEKNIDYLVEKDATQYNISQKMKAKASSGLKRGDTLYVYYSGHGTSTGDSGVFAKTLRDNPNILERLVNSAGLITYDFDMKHPEETLIITSRDFKPTFETLDDRGVNIVWIADACYAGNAYRSSSVKKSKYVTIEKDNLGWTPPKGKVKYNHLLFYGASVSTITTQEIRYKGEYRGAFSVELSNCLNEKTRASNISNKALKTCLEKNYSKFVFDSSVYPMDASRDTQKVIAARRTKQTSHHPRDNRTYKEKLFDLKNKREALKIKIYSENRESRAIDTFCYGEVLNIDLEKPASNVVALTMDIKGNVIMLYPNKNTQPNQKLKQVIQTEVQDPIGTDLVKVFVVDNARTYKTILHYKDREGGRLSLSEIENIYKALATSKKFSTTAVRVETIATPVDKCKEGDY